jgi:hypothetical protein
MFMNSSASAFPQNEWKTSIIQVNRYDEKQLQGIFQNPFYGKSIPFQNLIQLLSLMDSLLNHLDFPEEGMECRRFHSPASGPAKGSSSEVFMPAAPPLATFSIRILFRQHASWQGILTWQEQGLTSPFRSVLELIFLIDSVLTTPFHKHLPEPLNFEL